MAECTEIGSMMQVTEAFELVRTQYESKPRPREKVGPGHAKVVARNEKWFVPEQLDRWRVISERRKQLHHTGHSALNYLPYRTFGNLKHTDVYDLLGDHLGILMNKNYVSMLSYSHRKSHDQSTQIESPDLHTPDHELHNTIVVVADEADKQKKILPPSRSGGLSAIQAALDSDVQVLRDIAAGIPFQKMLAAHEKDTLENEEKYIEMQAAESSSSESIKTIGPSFYVASAAVQFKNQAGIGSLCLRRLKAIHARQSQQLQCVAKLKSIYAILCCLYNIKFRDLRKQEPLSYGVVKALAMKPLHSLTNNYSYSSRHLLHFGLHHHPSSCSLLSRRQSLWPALSQHCRQSQWTSLLSRRQSQSPVQSQHRRLSQWTSRRETIASRHVKLDSRAFDATPVIETWDELLDLHKRDTKNQQVSLSSSVSNPGSTAGTPNIQQPAMMGCSDTHTRQSCRVLPPWQQKVVFVESKDDSLEDPVQKLKHCIDLFYCIKSEMSQHVKSTLEEKKDKQRLQQHLLMKIEHLTLGANVDVCLEQMREQAHLVQSQERAEKLAKPAWFAILEDEAKVLFDVEDKETKLNKTIEKLKQFTHVDIETLIPCVLEKLCLLIMSLPATQLSIEPLVSAIEFVLQHILKRSPNLLTQLKNLRRLPSMTQKLQLDGVDTVYVLGHRV